MGMIMAHAQAFQLQGCMSITETFWATAAVAEAAAVVAVAAAAAAGALLHSNYWTGNVDTFKLHL